MRPEPKMLSTVVVMETTLPHLSTITRWVVPPGSMVWSGPNMSPAPGGLPAVGQGPTAVLLISLARSAT